MISQRVAYWEPEMLLGRSVLLEGKLRLGGSLIPEG